MFLPTERKETLLCLLFVCLVSNFRLDRFTDVRFVNGKRKVDRRRPKEAYVGWKAELGAPLDISDQPFKMADILLAVQKTHTARSEQVCLV